MYLPHYALIENLHQFHEYQLGEPERSVAKASGPKAASERSTICLPCNVLAVQYGHCGRLAGE